MRDNPALPTALWSPALGRRDMRLAALAVVLSLAVHLAILGLAPDWRHAAPPVPRVLKATLLAPLAKASPAPAAAIPAEPPPPARPAPPPKAQAAPPRPPVLTRSSTPEITSRVAKTAPDSVTQVAPVAATAPASQAAPQPSAPPPPTPAVPAEPAPAAVDPGALARYGRTLSDLLARQQQYPRIAAQRGWEGDVVLKLVIARKGQLVAAQVIHSSGHAVLDEYALALVSEVQPFPALPGQISGDDLEVTVPVHYQLKKG